MLYLNSHNSASKNKVLYTKANGIPTFGIRVVPELVEAVVNMDQIAEHLMCFA